jgi:hypothetical protein
LKSISQSYVPVGKSPIEGSIIVLTILTAIVHFFLAFDGGMPMGTLSILFLLNGIGYLALLTALYLPSFSSIQPVVRWVFIAYTALTIVLWVIITHASFDPFEYIDKLSEFSLVILLLIETFLWKISRDAQRAY